VSGFKARHEGGSEAVMAFGAASSVLEMPTRRKTFPMTRIKAAYLTSLPARVRYFKNMSGHPLTPVRRRSSGKLLLASSLFAGVFSLHTVGAWSQAKPAGPPPDVMVFTNGDQLTGTLEKAIGNSYTFKSDVVGEVTVTADKIKELRANGNYVVLKKGEVVQRVARPGGTLAADSTSVTVSPASSSSQTISVKDIEDVIDTATYNKEVMGNPGPLHGWKGGFTAGVTDVQATQYGETFTLAANLIRAIPSVDFLPPRTRSTVNVLETYGKLTQPTIPQTNPPTPNAVAKTSIFHADAEHDKYLNQKLYVLGDVSFDHNFSQGLDFQQIYGVGLGATVIKDAKQELDVKADVHYEHQSFIPPVQIPNQPLLPASPSLDLIGSSFAETYHRDLPAKFILTESGTIIPAWNNLNAYSGIGMVGLQFPVYHRFSFSTSLTDNFLNNPAFGYQKNSFQFVMGATYTLP
jgi:Protein of unknown function, DUF481